MSKKTLTSIIVITIILVTSVIVIKVVNRPLPYRDALANTVYAVLSREENINQNKVSSVRFKTEVVNKVISKKDEIHNPKDLEALTDKILRRLVNNKLHDTPIEKERFMNLIKIEYSVATRNTKVGSNYQE